MNNIILLVTASKHGMVILDGCHENWVGFILKNKHLHALEDQ